MERTIAIETILSGPYVRTNRSLISNARIRVILIRGCGSAGLIGAAAVPLFDENSVTRIAVEAGQRGVDGP